MKDKLPVLEHSQQHRSKCRSVMGAQRGSNAHGGPLVRLLSEDQDDNFDDDLDDLHEDSVNLYEGDHDDAIDDGVLKP